VHLVGFTTETAPQRLVFGRNKWTAEPARC